MYYPNYKELPSFEGKNHNAIVTLAYESYAMSFFVYKGYTPEAAAAICGNIVQESAFNPDIKGDVHLKGGSNGLAQWNNGPNNSLNGRYNKMRKYVVNLIDNNKTYESLTDQEKLYGQLNFIDYEIKSPQYKNAYKALIEKQHDSNLAGIFGHIYEGFGDNSNVKRDIYALSCLTRYYMTLTKLTSKPDTISVSTATNNSPINPAVNKKKLKISSQKESSGSLEKSSKPLEKTNKVGLRITPISYTKETFKQLIDKLDVSKIQWKPLFITLHNTAVPSLKQWMTYSPETKAKWPQNLNNYYSNLGWHSSVHIVCTPDNIWNLCNLLQDGVHASCFNKTSFGIEMLGDFEKEEFNSGQGLKVQNNAIEVVALLCNKFKWNPSDYKINEKGLHFHRECIKDHHPCPGVKVDKAKLIAKIEKRMAQLKTI